MKKCLLLVCSMFMLAQGVHAQETETTEFQPHWFIQVQGGINYTFGKIGTDLISPAAQVGVGYQFTPVWGLRFVVNGWENKGNYHQYNGIIHTYKWNYVAPALDVRINLVNAIAPTTYNPKRIFGLNLIAGVGMNIGFNNKGNYVEPAYYPMSLFWNKTKVRAVGRIGLDLDFRCSERVSINLESVANLISDNYNSQQDPNKIDCYITTLLGVKVNLGGCSKKEPKVETPAPIEEIVTPEPEPTPAPKTVPTTKLTPATQVAEPVKKTENNFFFAIRSTQLDANADATMDEIASIMRQNKNAIVKITGYADRETGNSQINQRYSEQRAQAVAQALKARGVDETRMVVNAVGDTEQPFSDNDKNRCVICIITPDK